MTHIRRIVLIATLIFACSAALPISSARARISGDVYVSFRADLAPYGEWFEYGAYGWVWRPGHVHHGWRPYVDGHWVLTDAGWTWVATEPWGWTPYHYGRWFDDASYGWVWVPGDEWAPAWVSWQSGGGYVGWAPLPPWAGWSGAGIATDVYIEPRTYSFVPARSFVALDVGRYVVPIERNTVVIRNTRNVTNYARATDRIVNRSLDPHEVERAVGHSIAPRRVETLHAAAPRALRGGEHDQGRASVRREKGRQPAREQARVPEQRERSRAEMRHNEHGAAAERAHGERVRSSVGEARGRHDTGAASQRYERNRTGATSRYEHHPGAAASRNERTHAAKRETSRAREQATSRPRPPERSAERLRPAPSRSERAARVERAPRERARARIETPRAPEHVTSPRHEPRRAESRAVQRPSQQSHAVPRTRQEGRVQRPPQESRALQPAPHERAPQERHAVPRAPQARQASRASQRARRDRDRRRQPPS